MRSFPYIAGLATAALLSLAPAVSAQQTSGIPAVFLDCNSRNCNQTYFRTEIGWVNWVRDRESSDIHLIMTSEGAGSGGEIYQLDFLGQRAAEGYVDQIRVPTLPTDTEREQLDQITSSMALGLVQFAAAQGFRDLVRIEIEALRDQGAGVEGVVASEAVEDPWDLWTFNISGNANFSGEDTRENRRIRSGFSASRVSPTWKLNFRGGVNYDHRRIERSDGPDFVDTRTDWSVNGLAVYSIADRVSVGARAEAQRIVSANQAFRWELSPAIEYSFFPYDEATRRSLTAYYQIGPAYREYISTTALGFDDELRWEQLVELELSQRQPWGEASISARGSHFLHDPELYNVRLQGDIEFRIVRGFSVSTDANVSWVRDQIYLAADGASSEEELLDLVRRGQSFTWGFEVGFNVRFGSIYNNVVNNRFGGGWWF